MDINKENQKLQKENEHLKVEIDQWKNKEKRRAKHRNWLLRIFGKFFVGINLKDSIKKSISEFNDKKTLSHETIADLSANLIKRFTRLGLFTLILSLIPIGLLFLQSVLLYIQNEKITEQTILFDAQTYLIRNQNSLVQQQVLLSDASRRSAQTLIMGEVLSDLNMELKNKTNQEHILSKTLTGRIISLSRIMKPYRYLVNDTLISKPLSPERGQLLLSLLESAIDTSFLRIEIFKKGDFRYADLEGIVLSDKSLAELDLTGANLKNSKLQGCNIFKTNFVGAELSNSSIYFSYANKSVFIDCRCEGLSIIESSFEDSIFKKANLEHATFSSGTMKGSDLRETSLEGATFGNFDVLPIFNNVRVDREDWLEYLHDSIQVRGDERIFQAYFIEKSEDKGVDFYDIDGNLRNSAESNPFKYLIKERADIIKENLIFKIGFH